LELVQEGTRDFSALSVSVDRPNQFIGNGFSGGDFEGDSPVFMVLEITFEVSS